MSASSDQGFLSAGPIFSAIFQPDASNSGSVHPSGASAEERMFPLLASGMTVPSFSRISPRNSTPAGGRPL